MANRRRECVGRSLSKQRSNKRKDTAYREMTQRCTSKVVICACMEGHNQQPKDLINDRLGVSLDLVTVRRISSTILTGGVASSTVQRPIIRSYSRVQLRSKDESQASTSRDELLILKQSVPSPINSISLNYCQLKHR